jgi:hypothetical protein
MLLLHVIYLQVGQWLLSVPCGCWTLARWLSLWQTDRQTDRQTERERERERESVSVLVFNALLFNASDLIHGYKTRVLKHHTVSAHELLLNSPTISDQVYDPVTSMPGEYLPAPRAPEHQSPTTPEHQRPTAPQPHNSRVSNPRTPDP